MGLLLIVCLWDYGSSLLFGSCCFLFFFLVLNIWNYVIDVPVWNLMLLMSPSHSIFDVPIRIYLVLLD
ncbi:hypothetical protein ACSBR1_031278 [Camellia fascicularis]